MRREAEAPTEALQALSSLEGQVGGWLAIASNLGHRRAVAIS
jgi:hypothetical protein